MADKTKIEWTDASWNPITGCTLVSEGCRHCYAARLAATRLQHHPSREGLARLNAAGEAKFTGEVRFNEQWLTQPLKWRKPRMIFVCAHGDLFHENVPDEWIDRIFAVMALSHRHTFQVLTKRPERMREYMTHPHRPGRAMTVLDDGSIVNTPAAHVSVRRAMCDLFPMVPPQALNAAADWQDKHNPGGDGFLRRWPLPNVWLGTSIEDQISAETRIPHLLNTPAAIRFISAEPLLGPVNLRRLDIDGESELDALSAPTWEEEIENGWRDTVPDWVDSFEDWYDIDIDEAKGPMHHAVDWVIVGGESGPGARPMHADWARSLRDQCAAAGTAFFFKQWGAWAHESQNTAMPDADRFFTSAGGMVPGLWHEWPDTFTSVRIGKKAAGRVLDGVEHNAMPGPR